MLKQFDIGIEDQATDATGILAIKYNIQSKLNRLEYLSYKKIDILLTYESVGNIVWWDDKRTANLRCHIEKDLLHDLSVTKNVSLIYKVILNCLKVLWGKNNWDENDLDKVYDQINEENFFVSIIFGKTYYSLNKKNKAEFQCEVFYNYADYFVLLSGKKSLEKRRIKFLKGIPVLELVFGFYCNAYWRDNEHFFLTDPNSEIFFIFNVNSDTCHIEFKPVLNTLEQCKNYIRAFEAGTTEYERNKLLGFPG